MEDFADLTRFADRIEAAVDQRPNIVDPDEARRIEAVQAAGQRLAQLVPRVPLREVSPSWRSGLETAFDPVVVSLEQWAADGGPLQIGWVETDRLWSALTPLLATVIPDEAVAEDAASFRRSTGQMVRRLTDEVNSGLRELTQMREALGRVAAERDEALRSFEIGRTSSRR